VLYQPIPAASLVAYVSFKTITIMLRKIDGGRVFLACTTASFLELLFGGGK
jgi:hypothetical protein